VLGLHFLFFSTDDREKEKSSVVIFLIKQLQKEYIHRKDDKTLLLAK